MVALLLVRWLYWFELEISDADLRQLCQLQHDRLLLLPNHPTFHDPIVMFTLSAKVKQFFYYLAAHETFENPSTLFLISARFAPMRMLAKSECFKQGFRRFLQNLGLYSIRRGLADRPSIAQTIDLLSQPGCHLVIFPEGGCSFQNDTVMPFRAGGVQLAFQAMNRLVKHGEEIPDLYVIPVAIKYRYVQDMQPVIKATLRRLEKALGLSSSATVDEYARLQEVGRAILIKIEKEYELYNPEINEKSWDDRINLIRLRVIQEGEQRLSINSASGDLIRERVYRIQHAIRTKADAIEPDPTFTPELVEKAMSRLLNFDAIYASYVAEKPTPERFLDTLIRLEREVFNIDQPPPKGFRRAQLQLGKPVNLKDHFDAYRHDRAASVSQLVSEFHHTVQTRLDQLNYTCET
ncbi:MAG: hypothetical protein Kow00121_13560 [Elainellaceae cyanobacterium]